MEKSSVKKKAFWVSSERKGKDLQKLLCASSETLLRRTICFFKSMSIHQKKKKVIFLYFIDKKIYFLLKNLFFHFFTFINVT